VSITAVDCLMQNTIENIYIYIHILPLLVHCNLSEDIQQLCLTVTINGMQQIHPVI